MWLFILLFCLRSALYIPACILAGKRKAIRREPLPAIPFSLGIGPYIGQSFALFGLGCIMAAMAWFWLDFFWERKINHCACFEEWPPVPPIMEALPCIFLPGMSVVAILTFINNLRRLRDLKWPKWLAFPLSIPFFGAFASFFFFIIPGAANGFDAARSPMLRWTKWFSVFALLALLGVLFG